MIVPNSTLRTTHLEDIADALDAGSGPGVIKAYSAPQPAPGASITTQTLIGTAVLSDPCGTVSGDTLTLTEPAPLEITANGTIAWVRFPPASE